MKQHMMTHKLREMPQHLYSKKMEQRNKSPDGKDTPSLRVKSEAELNPRSATTPERYEPREKLPSHLHSQVSVEFHRFFLEIFVVAMGKHEI